MAEEALKKLEEQLQCSICLDTYTNPKQLQCNHVYCQKCLVRLVVQDQQGQQILHCPNCRQVTPIPASGVAGLQSAFQINNLLEIFESLNKVKNLPPAQEDTAIPECATFPVSATSSASELEVGPNCMEHVDEELKLFCETCEQLVCLKCVIRDSKHQNHNYELLDKAYDHCKDEIEISLKPVEVQLASMNRSLLIIDTNCGDISDQRVAIEAKVHNTTRRLHETLDVRMTEIIGQIHQITQRKLKVLETQRDQIETQQTQLKQCLNTVKESLQSDKKAKVLETKTSVIKQIKELTTRLQPEEFKPHARADTVFSASSKAIETCQTYGELFETEFLPDLSEYYTTGSGFVGEKSTVVVHAVNHQGIQCEEEIESFQCKLVSELTDTMVENSIVRSGLSKYEISYQPAIKGRHQLHITVEDQHIKGSPFTLCIKSPVEKLGTPISTIDDVKSPWGVVVNQKGEIIVTEHDRHCISVFSPRGEKLRSFGTRGSGDGEFNHPHGATVDGDGNIFVADYKNHRIQKFTADGTFISKAGVKLSWSLGNLRFMHPKGIAFSASNNKVYVVDESLLIHVLDTNLKFSGVFFKHNTSTKQRWQWDACGIACDSFGNVYMADSIHDCIQVFTAEGRFLMAFGKRGQDSGRLNFPAGIAFDSNNMLYVSERYNHRISRG